MRRQHGRIAAALCCACTAAAVNAADPPDNDLAALAGLSIEQLLDEPVTSVSRREQRLSDVAAAVSVLPGGELQRSGATSPAEALRMVPGIDAAAVNAGLWAISSRGFNSVYSNKLLVLVDGRAVYTPLFAGVYWDLQQTMMEDLDRIEVIRGPGATIWGANAVNGVINIVSRDAQQTQGTLLYGGGGDVRRADAGLRYGGQAGSDTWYRVFGSYQSNAGWRLANGLDAQDGGRGGQAGFRVDHDRGNTHLTWQADASLSDHDHSATLARNFNTLLHWRRKSSERASLEFQAYLDRTQRNEAVGADTSSDTLDLQAQQTLALVERNDLIGGLGYRYIHAHLTQTNPAVAVRDPDIGQQLYSAFVQDEFAWVPDRLALTAGAKLEHNDYTGLEIQPSVRAVFKPAQQQALWAAVSRAVRTPSIAEGRDVFAVAVGAPVTGPGGAQFVPTLVGDSNLAAEVLWAYELGYRIQPARRLSIDAAAFHNRYSRLISYGAPQRFVAGAPAGIAEIPFGNLLGAQTDGAEIAAKLSLPGGWRLGAGYSLLVAQIHGSADPQALGASAPRHQARLWSGYDPTPRSNVMAQLRYVDGVTGAPAYVTADLRLSYRAGRELDWSLTGRNLFDPGHAEVGPQINAVAAEVPRGIYGKLVWRPQ